MIRRIVQRIALPLLRARVSSYDSLVSMEPFSALRADELGRQRRLLEPYYRQYVREVSRPDMAISLELATFLYAACGVSRCRRVLDLGSGFSSFVLRMFAREAADVRVFSVDDDAAWLEKTRVFLGSHGLDTRDMVLLGDFLAQGERDFDLILFDLNLVEIRIRYLRTAMDLAKPLGLVLLDDIHKLDYQLGALTALTTANSRIFSLEPVTLDQYGRYAFLAMPTGKV